MSQRKGWYVEEIWPGSTVAVIGGGPSLTQEQVDRCRGRVKVIAINDALRLAPWADLHYFCDDRWWRWHKDKDWYRAFRGLRVTLENPHVVAAEPGVRALQNYGWDANIAEQHGLTRLRDGVLTGRNGGYQAVHLAVHLGVKRILLLGFDMRMHGAKSHWFGRHPEGGISGYDVMLACFETMVRPLAERRIEVINCTPGSALACFTRGSIESVLPDQTAAALPA